jgi:23S rRNA (guanosine2251-2'-O)-methyltransferase
MRPARPNRHSQSPSPGKSIGKIHDESDLEALLQAHPNPLVLVLDCVQDPHNLGACLRTADAAGVAAVILPKDKSAPITETVLRVSCGGAEHVPIVRVTNLVRAMEKLKELGIWLVGTAEEATQSIYQIDLKGPIGIVMGAEGSGMRRLTSEHCDFLANIPMAGHVECLNVSVATGVCLFETVRQRQ